MLAGAKKKMRINSKRLHSLKLSDVASGYIGTPVLDKISFRADENAIYVVLGPNRAERRLSEQLLEFLNPL